ncbi:MAG: hypothetical protein C4532_00555 [Candidatus Abyssobacteria bacterium SURF_17]|uniref:Cytochrome c domain-containing protein n=1 Tax=Candidatus Abyssobacteria bacterium SURF_17 TaxID=2093361 RepID=A0A419F9F7_9BACT|nr:MAG: hypothetical protein C4532_00555 [Candidatus Abyssubacteria bacterium SURF_17]
MIPQIILKGRTTVAPLALFGAILLLVGCAGLTNSLPIPEHLMEQGAVRDDSQLDSLRRGRALAVTECTECHRLYWPGDYAPDEWPRIIRKMGYRTSLDAGQLSDLELYHVTASRAARQQSGGETDLDAVSE